MMMPPRGAFACERITIGIGLATARGHAQQLTLARLGCVDVLRAH
jgi:hypothetical protein